jgi:mannose-6-phosphate isomerase-like protein (cupin superfamily)
MPVMLNGGCVVSEMREGSPLTRGTLSVWQQVGHSVGAQAISLRILEFDPGESPALGNKESDEVFYFLENLRNDSRESQRAVVSIDGSSYEVEPQTGIYLRPGQTMIVNNSGAEPVVFVSSQCPEPQTSGVPFKALTRAETLEIPIATFTRDETAVLRSARPPIVRLADREAIPTANRWYRVLVDDEIGSVQVTQFVGSIPPGRAPDHFHNYEEVLFILRGRGRMWAGDSQTPISPGSCVFLPRGQVHCVENTGEDELRLLGVFYPAGSPAVRYES